MGLKFDYHDEKSIPNGYQFFTKADNKKFIKGWKPKYMLEDGIKSYLKYLSKIAYYFKYCLLVISDLDFDSNL